MNKEIILKEKQMMIKNLQKDIECIKKIELKRLYKIPELRIDNENVTQVDTYGYFECFNRESIRFCVVASDIPNYGKNRRRGFRANINSFHYVGLYKRLTQVYKDELPLLVGLQYKSVELEKIFKGKKRIKINA